MGIWNPARSTVKIIGNGYFYIDAYTPRSLLAWTPGSCQCAISITNTATLATVTVRSPSRYGFALGGAFSPDGARLAVFVNTGDPVLAPAARLAFINTRTGALRLVGHTGLGPGEDEAWARWLPGGYQLAIGSLTKDYLVTAATQTVTPFRFMPVGDGYIEDTQDINYSAVLVPGTR